MQYGGPHYQPKRKSTKTMAVLAFVIGLFFLFATWITRDVPAVPPFTGKGSSFRYLVYFLFGSYGPVITGFFAGIAMLVLGALEWRRSNQKL